MTILACFDMFIQEKIRGQRGKLPVQPLGYVNCTKVIYRGSLERKSVFRDVRIKANLDLMFLVNANVNNGG